MLQGDLKNTAAAVKMIMEKVLKIKPNSNEVQNAELLCCQILPCVINRKFQSEMCK